MGTAAIIVLGVVLVTIISVFGDMASKLAQAKIKSKTGDAQVTAGEIERLKDRLAILEGRAEEREESIRKLQEEVRFVSRMLEDKSGGHPGG